jgi:hypothetical protein
MATTTAVWNEGNTLRSAATLSSGGTSTHDLDINDNATTGVKGADTIVLQFDITHSSSTGITVELFSSPDSGTTDDTESLAGGFSTDGTDVTKTVVVMGHPHIQVKLTNDDGSNATGNIAILYAARTWDTT